MIGFLSHFSAPVVAVMMIAIFLIPSIGCLWLVKRFCKPLLFTHHTDFGGIFSNAIGVVFALILAFVAVAVWQNYDRIDDSVSKEANTLNNIYCNMAAYPEPVRTESQVLIREYVQRVIKDEWPKLARGEQDETAQHLLIRINRLILTYIPRHNGELVLHQETMRHLNDYRGLRHDRILGGDPKLGSPMWITLIGGTILFLLYLCFFDVPSFLRHAVMIGTMATVLGLVFYLLVLYNFPFDEPTAISTESFQKLLEYWKINLIPSTQ